MSEDLGKDVSFSLGAETEQQLSSISICPDDLKSKECLDLDHITCLPDLCLLEICKHLKRKDLCEVNKVSRRMWAITSDESLDSIKWEGGYLIIAPTKRGYGFEFWITYEGSPQVKLQYEIFNNEEGVFCEEKVTDGTLQLSGTHPDFAVPDEFFTALAEMLRTYEARKIRIFSIFGSLFFSKLDLALKGQHVLKLKCVNLKATQITNESRKSFARLIKKRVKEIDLGYSPQIISLVNEDFLLDIVESKIVNFEYFVTPQEAYVHRFEIRKATISQIVNLDSLHAYSMLLNANWAVRLIMEYMVIEKVPKRSDIGRWRFAVDQPIDGQIIAQNVNADFEYILDGVKHTLINKHNRNVAKFQAKNYDVDEGRAIFYLVDVIFFNNDPVLDEPFEMLE